MLSFHVDVLFLLLQLLPQLHILPQHFLGFGLGISFFHRFPRGHFIGKGLVLLANVLEALGSMVKQEGLVLFLVLRVQQPVLL